MIGRTNVGGGGGGGSFKIPQFTYTGDYSMAMLDDKFWSIRFLSSGTFTLTDSDLLADIFCVGGGGGGTSIAGGGGGYTATHRSVICQRNVAYPIVIGAGGAGHYSSASNGQSSYFNNESISAEGGKGAKGQDTAQAVGGNGGSGGGANDGLGGSDGSDGVNGSSSGTAGTGQGTTTKEFGEDNKSIYSGGGNSGMGDRQPGGGGMAYKQDPTQMDGIANTGGGGGRGRYAGGGIREAGGTGGSGIVVIRSHK